MKCGKAPRTDNIYTEMLKTDIHFAGTVFTYLFRDIWTNYVIPNDWNRGLIVKLPKKGDLQSCDNWREKHCYHYQARVLPIRIEGTIDVKLRQENTGLCRGKGCTDQIFSLCNIIEQSIEWNTPLCIGFIDFKKAYIQYTMETPESLWTVSSVSSGVRQGCILSPILFNIALDYIMRQTTHNTQHGIQWTIFSQLENIDNADDITL